MKIHSYVTRFFGAALLLFVSAVGAHACDEEKLALAVEIVELAKVTQALDQIFPAVMQQQSQMIEQMSGGKQMTEAQKQKYDLTMKYFAEEMGVASRKLIEMVPPMYARKFSLEDLRALRDFYASDVGQRFVDGGIELSQEMMGAAQQWAMNDVMPAVQRAMQRAQSELGSK